MEQKNAVNVKKNTLGQKLTSRKLWTAIVGIIVGLAAAFGLPDNDIAQVAGIVTSAMSVVSYIMGESKVDAAAARKTELETLFGRGKTDSEQ